MISISLDTMGGENAPRAALEAALLASRDKGLHLILCGPKERLEPVIPVELVKEGRISFEDVSETIEMDEPPVLSVKKKPGASLVKAIELLKAGTARAAVGAGNTGSMVFAAINTLGRLPGVSRPGLLGILPGKDGPVALMDVGANVDTRPKHLKQFASLGRVFWECYTDKKPAKVGLLNIGEEEGKGNRLAKEAWWLIKRSSIPFVGNVEGHEILLNKADVVICDGFVGNVLLKALEGMGELFLKEKTSPKCVFGGSLSWEEQGGAVLMGVDGIVVVCHGRSSGKALHCAITFAKELVQKDIMNCIKTALKGGEEGCQKEESL